MKIAIIGSGFCGLGAAYFLAREGKAQITLFDSKGIGGGASGIAAGLLHPYPGERGRKSWRSSEALAATLSLLKEVELFTGRRVACYDGIIRVAQGAEIGSYLSKQYQDLQDIQILGENRFFIRSGVTVDCKEYLLGLWEIIQSMGVHLELKKVKDLLELEDYDRVILAAGNGIFGFKQAEQLPLNRTKGQVLKAEIPSDFSHLTHSLIGSGYLARMGGSSTCYLGSTYERGALQEEPDFDFAASEILPKIDLLLPQTANLAAHLKLIECRADFRVGRIGHYHPIIARLTPSLWAITAMKSRGLLYHAYAARMLAEAVFSDDTQGIPSEMGVWAHRQL